MKTRRPQTTRRRPRKLFRVFCRMSSTLLQEVRFRLLVKLRTYTMFRLL